ncbi:hypothetical protein VTI74DRAFT_725 [Chaetomium olivicolor]
MDQQPQQFPPQKGTPARRRAKRPVNSPARRTYASENDMGSEPLFPMDLQGPFTPQKSASNSPAPRSQPNQTKSKPRNGNSKVWAKQVSSPGPARPGRTTPPPTTNKPVAAPAFAGATFHASPAPSSLPIPSFLAKALDSPSVRDPDAGREPSPPATDSDAPTPQHRLLSTDPAHQESPLDIFFRADRAEKERARRASSANILGPNPVPFSPPAQIRSPQEPSTLPSNLFGVNNRRPGFQRNSSGGIPTSELDGTPGGPIGPAISRPFQDRIRAARSSVQKQPGPVQNSVAPQQDPATDDRTERLKRLLAIPQAPNRQSPSQGPAAPPGFRDAPRTSPPAMPNPAPTTAAPATSTAPSMPFSSSEASQPYPTVSPPGMSTMLATSTPPAPALNNGRTADIQHIEDSLRRILRLSPGGAPAAPAANYLPNGPQNYPPHYPQNYPPNYPPSYQSS